MESAILAVVITFSVLGGILLGAGCACCVIACEAQKVVGRAFGYA